MRESLPKFERETVNGSVVKFAGSKQFPVYAFDHGEDVVFLVRGRVSSVNHVDRDKVGLVREHSLTLTDVVVPDQDTALAQLVALRDAFENEHADEPHLPLDDDDTVVDMRKKD